MAILNFGLKLWTNNEVVFAEAAHLCEQGEFQFIELYHNPQAPLNDNQRERLKPYVHAIHAPHTHGFHEFILGQEQQQIWRDVQELATAFSCSRIILHPGQSHTFDSFQKNLRLIDDPRVIIENMAGLDLQKKPMFGQLLPDLKRIKEIKEICFDIEKAVKAACYQGKEYRKYIQECLKELQPRYFHLSGGEATSPIDQHTNLWESDIDFRWVKDILQQYAHARQEDIFIVLETPKGKGLENDLKNKHHFEQL